MVKHNNIIPNQHFHKQWQRRIKTWFDQPAKKKARRMKRAAKAAKIAPRPASGLLRPQVKCPTLKYNVKARLGRGFSLAELKEAGINRKAARGLGIAVDHRRTNKSVEALQANVARLNEYKNKLIVFPRRSNQAPKDGDSSPEETSQATQFKGTILPLVKESGALEMAEITEEMQAEPLAYSILRDERNTARMAGIRARMLKEKKEKEEKGGKKKGKK